MAVKVQFKPVGPSGHEWIWKARDESNTISIAGQRFDSLSDAVRDGRIQIDGLDTADDPDDDGSVRGLTARSPRSPLARPRE